MRISRFPLALLACLSLADVAGANCNSTLVFTGDPINRYTREQLLSTLSGAPEILETLPGGRVVVQRLRFEHLWNEETYFVTAKRKPRLTPIFIEGSWMLVRPAGLIAGEVADQARSRGDVDAPRENYAVDYFDGRDVSVVSKMYESQLPLELTPDEARDRLAATLASGRDKGRRHASPIEMIRLNHDHPIHECLVHLGEEDVCTSHSPLGEEDIDFARRSSLRHPNVTVVISAVTHGDLEYQMAFRNGIDVTLKSVRLILRAERSLARLLGP